MVLILARWETIRKKDIKTQKIDKNNQIDPILMNLFIIHSVLWDSIKIGSPVNDDLIFFDLTLYLILVPVKDCAYFIVSIF